MLNSILALIFRCSITKNLNFYAFYYIAVQFIFTPSPNIGVYQLAHYQCSVDHIGVGITWLINGTCYGHNEIIQIGIVTSGIPQHSNLRIHGYPQYNNTVVRCNAFGFVNGNSYVNFSESTLRIQGISKHLTLLI